MEDKILDKDNIDLVMYHGSCSDGFGSAFIVWYYYCIKFGKDRANSIRYIPCYYSDQQKDNKTSKLLALARGKNILMCDFSYGYDYLVKLIESSNTFKILDHHKTSRDNLINIPDNIKTFNMMLSGVGLTNNLFFPNEKLPLFLAHIQDRDLWQKKIPNNEEFIVYFYEQPFDFELWKTYLDDNKVSQAINQGKAWINYRDIIISKIVSKTNYVLHKHDNDYVIVGYANNSEFKSDIGNKILDVSKFIDFSCIWDYQYNKNHTQYSLRSSDERIDVSQIASKFGGGGHRNAAGIVFPNISTTLPLEIINDHGLLDYLLKAKVGEISLKTDLPDTNDDNEESDLCNTDANMSNENPKRLQQKYLLIKVYSISQAWTDVELFTAVKKRFSHCDIIVFEKPSREISINSETHDIIKNKDYVIYYNEYSIKNTARCVRYAACATKDAKLEITSDKNFEELFSY